MRLLLLFNIRQFYNIGKKESCPGMTYVALSRVRTLSSCVIEPRNYERLSKLNSSKALQYRQKEEHRLHELAQQTFKRFTGQSN